MTSDKILKLLRIKHTDDIIIPELTVGAGRLDAWVMKRSWANPLTIGYEIKVDKQDFRNDSKWMGYRTYANEFYFVCPQKLIYPNDLPEGIGLMWVSTTGTRLYTKRKAVYCDRDPKHLAEAYKTVLINRVRIVERFDVEKVKDSDYWKEWLQTRDEEKDIGWRVSRKLRELVSSRIYSVKCENDRLKKRIEELEKIEVWLEEQGLSKGFSTLHTVKARQEKLKEAVPRELFDSLSWAKSNIEKVERNLWNILEGSNI